MAVTRVTEISATSATSLTTPSSMGSSDIQSTWTEDQMFLLRTTGFCNTKSICR